VSVCAIQRTGHFNFLTGKIRQSRLILRIGTMVLLRHLNSRFLIEDCALDLRITLNDASQQFPLPTSDVDDRRDSGEVVCHQNGVSQHRRDIGHSPVESVSGFRVSLKVLKQTCSEHIVERWRTGLDTMEKLSPGLVMKDGPKSCSALAAATGADRQSLFRLMRALSSAGVFAQVQNGVVGNSSLTGIGEELPVIRPVPMPKHRDHSCNPFFVQLYYFRVASASGRTGVHPTQASLLDCVPHQVK